MKLVKREKYFLELVGDKLKIAYSYPCKIRNFSVCDWIGHPEVIAERSTVNPWHCPDSGARGQVEDVIASLDGWEDHSLKD